MKMPLSVLGLLLLQLMYLAHMSKALTSNKPVELQYSEEHSYLEDKLVLEIVTEDRVLPTGTIAFQTASNGGMLQKSVDVDGAVELSLTLHGVPNITAVLEDVHNPETAGAKMAPTNTIQYTLPTFAVLFASNDNDNTPDAYTTNASSAVAPQLYSVIALDLLELISYEEEDYDPTNSDATLCTIRYKVAHNVDKISGLPIEESTLYSQSFTEAALLIDLVDAEDISVPESRRNMTLGHMAKTGELAYNVDKLKDPNSANSIAVQAQGVLTIGWMVPFSLWSWVCCPAWIIVCPICIPTILICCV